MNSFFDLTSTTLPHLDRGLSTLALREPAVFPRLTRLHIVCVLIPQRPIDMEFHPALAGYGSNLSKPPPLISLGDVLPVVAVHRAIARLGVEELFDDDLLVERNRWTLAVNDRLRQCATTTQEAAGLEGRMMLIADRERAGIWDRRMDLIVCI